MKTSINVVEFPRQLQNKKPNVLRDITIGAVVAIIILLMINYLSLEACILTGIIVLAVGTKAASVLLSRRKSYSIPKVIPVYYKPWH